MKRIIVDFDNTMGVDGCDVDDGLALLYLLGCDDAAIEGICATYGNSTLETVYENTRRIVEEWGLDVPIYRGKAASLDVSVMDDEDTDASTDTPSEAAAFIANALTTKPGQIHILATGSTTNLGEAALVREGCLGQAASFDLMGGVTESLRFNGKIMDELNLSCDPRATALVLSSGAPCAIATSQHCIPAFFTREDLIVTFGEGSWMDKACDNWFRIMHEKYDWDGWVCWDVVAAAHLMHPELFHEDIANVTLYERFLSVGYLERLDDAQGSESIEDADEELTAPINLPIIKDPTAFKRHVMDMWRKGAFKIAVH